MIECCICKDPIPLVGDWDKGNDAWPVADGRCCNDCDMAIVTPARLGARQVRACNCGSNMPRRWLTDARGITVASVCNACEAKVKARYRPEIFMSANYECDEQVEELD